MRRSPWNRLARALLGLVLAPWLAGPATGQPAGTPGGAPLGIRFVLPNGLVVLVAERPALPIVIVRVAVGAGAAHDPPDQAGLANLTAALLPRGTASRTAQEIDRAIEFVGGSLDAEGGRDWATLSVSVLQRDLTLGLDLLADVLLRPTFPVDEFERKREEIHAAVRRAEEDPEAVAGRAVRRLAFPGHAYGQPIIGTEASLERISREDVAAFYRAAYRPQLTVVAVVGAVTAAGVRAALAARLGGWRGAPPGVSPPRPVALGTPARTETVPRRLTQATVLLGQATVTHRHSDYHALVVGAHILGGGSSSRLFARIREERGLAYTVYADYAPTRYGGMMVVGLQSATARVREALGLAREEVARLRRERVSDDELARAKAYLVGSFPLRMDTNAEVAGLLIGIEEYGLGLDYPTRYRRAIEAVTADEVLRAARTHWDPDLMSLVVVGNVREAGF